MCRLRSSSNALLLGYKKIAASKPQLRSASCAVFHVELTTINLAGCFLFSNKKFREELMAYFPLIRHGPHRK
jgi:hypothetical protein